MKKDNSNPTVQFTGKHYPLVIEADYEFEIYTFYKRESDLPACVRVHAHMGGHDAHPQVTRGERKNSLNECNGGKREKTKMPPH